MAKFIALRILDGTFNYEQIFSFKIYKRYQEETDAILKVMGKPVVPVE